MPSEHQFKYHGKITTGRVIHHFKRRNLYRISKIRKISGIVYTTVTLIPRKDKE